MAQHNKPSKVPRWADTGIVVEPSEDKKDSGWINLEKPPFSLFNYLQNLTGKWFKWIDERFADGATADALQTAMPLEFDGDNDFVAHHRAGNPSLSFKGQAGNTYIFHDVTNDEIELWVGGNLQLRLTPKGAFINADLELGDDLVVPGGLSVGFSGTPVDDIVAIGDANSRWYFDGTDPRLQFDHAGDSPDEFSYDRSTDAFQFKIRGREEAEIGKGYLSVSDLKLIKVGPSDRRLHLSNDEYIQGRVDSLRFHVNNIPRLSVLPSGAEVDGDVSCRAVNWNGQKAPSVISPNDEISFNPICARAKNVSGKTITQGDVVILAQSLTNEIHVAVTEANAHENVFGVVYDSSIAHNRFGLIQVWGPGQIKVRQHIIAGARLGTWTPAGVAAYWEANPGSSHGVIAQATKTVTASQIEIVPCWITGPQII